MSAWVRGRAPWERFVACIVAAAGAWYAQWILRLAFRVGGETYFCLGEDSMISMRYAMNLAQGHGLRWNPGEAPVEGYTNLLWTLWMALLHCLPVGVSGRSLLVLLSAAAILLANIVVVARLAHRVSGRSPLAAGLAAGLCAVSAPLAFWSLVGLEVGLLVLLVDLALLWGMALAEGDRARRGDAAPLARLALVLAALALVRTDALVPALVVVAYVVARSSPGRRWRRAAWLLAALALTVALHTVFRVGYYGDVLPNTYYLKVTGVSALERLARGMRFLLWSGGVHFGALLVPAVLTVIDGRAGARSPRVLACAAVVAGQLGYSVYVGGDAWEYLDFANRYITTAIGPLAVLCAVGIARASEGPWGQGRRVLLLRGLAVAGAVAFAARSFEVARYPDLLGLARGTWAQVLVGAGCVALAGRAAALAVSPRALDRIAAWLSSETPRENPLARWTPTGQALVWLAILVALADGWFLARRLWNPGNESVVASVRQGLLLRAALRPGARIAVFAAGAVPYFSQALTIDLLGKSDPVIARTRPRVPFFPGHDKWDYAYSIGRLRPDLVVGIWGGPVYERTVPWRDYGYVRLANGMYLREDTRRVRRDVAQMDWNDPAVLETLSRCAAVGCPGSPARSAAR